MSAVDWEALRESLKNLYAALEPYAEAIGEGLIDFIEKIKDFGVDLLNALPEPIQRLADALKSGDPDKIREWVSTLLEFAVAVEGIKLAFSVFESVKTGLALFGIGGSVATAGTTAAEAAVGIGKLSGALGLLAEVATALGVLEMSKSLLIDLGEAAGISAQNAEYMRERYSGLEGNLNLVKDPVSILTNGIQGLGWEMSNSLGAAGALETAMENAADGMIYTDEQLSKLQNNFGLTDEDMEMLRQSMLDMHPELRNLADNFTELNTASVESLEEIYFGLQDVSNGIYDADDAASFLYGRFGDLTETTKVFFDNMATGVTSIDDYKTSLENASGAVQKFSDDIDAASVNIGTGLTKGLENVDVETPVRGFFTSIVENLRSVFDMHSPAKNMEPFGENILLGVLVGFKNSFSMVQEAVLEFFQNMQLSFSESLKNIQIFFTETWTAIYESTIETWTMIQEYFTEFWLLFIESLIETWEEILLIFTENFEQVQLLFEEFITFLNEMFLVSWLEAWTLAGQQYQTFHDLLTVLTKAVQEMITLFMKKIGELINTIWKNAWNNAKNIFVEFKNNVEELSNNIREIVQSLFDFVMSLIAQMLAGLESVAAKAASLSAGGFSLGGGGGSTPAAVSYSAQNFAAYTADLPHLASGSVIRGGNPFMAILGDQRIGQTNVEAPARLIKDMARQGIREELAALNLGGGIGQTRVVLNVNGTDVGEAILDDLFSVMQRRGYDVDVLGVT